MQTRPRACNRHKRAMSVPSYKTSKVLSNARPIISQPSISSICPSAYPSTTGLSVRLSIHHRFVRPLTHPPPSVHPLTHPPPSVRPLTHPPPSVRLPTRHRLSVRLPTRHPSVRLFACLSGTSRPPRPPVWHVQCGDLTQPGAAVSADDATNDRSRITRQCRGRR